ncbi:hypothetical protein FIBSPDRAFT_914783 [Athelia psychrophila]|uniref:Yeast cell wall synthesis Kre9/Knh1-like N-terminal domain-containing protein n=1 Tax=Athelia psychrophila TaxID=1759441 RepID=A0A167WE04_9AGAM|nr:hypothetical protein FIBSPDRAFT_914783 [Fibularhizoctonia sp. CBS 109695]
MFSLLVIPALLAAVASVHADPNPNTPGPGAVYNEGAACPIAWDVDPTGKWTDMKIELMTGANLDMVTLMTVTTVDGTDATKNTFSWTCPDVTPNAAEYFYQFTSASSTDTLWTTRFTIASSSGATTAAATPTQQGTTIPWGVGSIVGGSGASSTGGSAASSTAPATSSAASSSAGSSSASSSSASIASPATSAPATTASASTASGLKTSATSAPLTIGQSASSKTGVLSTPSTSASGSSANAAVGAFSVDARLYQTAAALFVAAAGLNVLL